MEHAACAGQRDSEDLKASVAQIEKQIEALLDRIVDSGNATVIAAYEKRITKLEREKVRAREKLAANGKPGSPWKSRSNTRSRFFQALGTFGKMQT
jgi:hypothetical protein